MWGGACLIAGVLAAEGMFDFMARTADQAITVTTVVNTELILNVAALGFAGLVVGGVAPLVAHAGRVAPLWVRFTGCVLIVIAIVRSGGDVMLGLLQLGLLEATSERISVVAKINQLAPFVTYADLVLVGLLAWACFMRRRRLRRRPRATRKRRTPPAASCSRPPSPSADG